MRKQHLSNRLTCKHDEQLGRKEEDMEGVSMHFQKLGPDSVGKPLSPVCTAMDSIPNMGRKYFRVKV